jgi:hypothetical protein
VSQIYTDFFNKPTTNWLTNALVTVTNSNPARTNTYPTIFTYTAVSNTTTRIPNINATFVNGILVTNNSANTLILVPDYTGN